MKRLLFCSLFVSLYLCAWVPLSVIPYSEDVSGGADLGAFVSLDDRGIPSAASRARVSRTADALLVHIVCDEPFMSKLHVTATRRDEAAVWMDDCVEVFIQPAGWREYAHFAVNPLGTIYDEKTRNAAWNAECSATTTRDIYNWSVTLRVPFKSLGNPPRKDAEWRLGLFRSRKAVPELSGWNVSSVGFHNPESFGVIRFSDEPFPSSIAWKTPSRRNISVTLNWKPAGAKVITRLNDKPTEAGASLYVKETGFVPIRLECLSGGKTILRALTYVNSIEQDAPLKKALKLIKTSSTEEAEALRAEIIALQKLMDSVPPESLSLFTRLANDALLRAGSLRVRDAFSAVGKEHSIPYGVTSSLVKVLRDRPFEGAVGGPVRLDAARREMDAAQVVLFAGESPLLLVQATVNGAFKCGEATLPASALRLRRVGYVHTCKPVYRPDYKGPLPDPLMECVPFDVAAYSFETLWLDVRVPANTKPGLYKGAVTVAAMNSDPTVIPVEVLVRNFTIPRTSSIITAFGMGPHWRVPQDKEAYLDNMLEHRITPYSCVKPPVLLSLPLIECANARALEVIVTSDNDARLTLSLTPADAQTVTFEPRPLKAGQRTTLTFPADTFPGRRFTRIALTVRAPAATLEAAFINADGTRRTLFPQSRKTAEFKEGWLSQWPFWSLDGWQESDIPAVFDWSDFDRDFQRALDKGITSHRADIRQPFGLWAGEYQKHLASKGWLKYFYTYLYDEPLPSAYPKVNGLLSQIKLSPPGRLLNMMTARSFPPELPFVDIWCPELYSFKPDEAAAEQRKGRAVWWYVAFSTRHPYPDVWIDYPALDCRVWPWMSWKHDIDGMLYWSITYWSRNDPWRSGETFHDSNGDGSILYPGRDGKPVDSQRWECLRDGLEDYEVFCLLEAGIRELGTSQPALAARARALCDVPSSVLKSYKDYNPDYRQLLKTRAGMSACLEEIVQALGHEPAIQGRPRRRLGVSSDEVREAVTKMKKTQAPSSAVNITLPAPRPAQGLRLLYDFNTTLPFLFDASGNDFDGMPVNCKRCNGPKNPALQILPKGYVELPSGIELLGTEPREGTVTLRVCPDFNPPATHQSDFYACLFYIMEYDGNVLPDGFDEIGLYLKNDRLFARVGGKDGIVFAAIPNPFKKGVWTHVAITWKPNLRILYINGKPAVTSTAPFSPPRLDVFKATLGAHAPHRGFTFTGLYDDFSVWDRALTLHQIEQMQ